MQASIAGLRTPLAAARPALAARRAVVCSASKDTKRSEVQLNASLAPALTLAAVNPIYEALKGPADYFSSLGLPEPLIHWGHPGNMAVVLFALGLYGAGYLGWQIRISDDAAVIKKAQDLHPKLSVAMAVFFALGATGGMMSLIMQDKPIFSSTHAWTGIAGLVLLALQAMLPSFFEDDPNARSMHAYLGSAILALFLVHAALGLQLGLSI